MTQPANGRNDYTGTGGTSVYPFTFPCPVASHVKVVVAAPVSGVESTLAQGVDYQIAITAGGGSISLAAGPLALDWKLSILLRPPYIQDSDIKNNASYYRESQEQDHDRRVRQIIALADEVGRSLKLPETEVGTPELTKIPSFEQRINKFAYWNGLGQLTAVPAPSGGGGGGGGGGSQSSDYQGSLLAAPAGVPTNLEITAMPAQPTVIVGMGLELELVPSVPGIYELTLYNDPGRTHPIADYLFDTTQTGYDTTPFGFTSADASGKIYAKINNLAGGGPSNCLINVKLAAIALAGVITASEIQAQLATTPGLEFVVEGLVSALRAKCKVNGGVQRGVDGLESDATVLRTSGAGQTKADLLTFTNGFKLASSGIVGAPVGAGAHTAGEIVRDANGNLWICTADGTPGVWEFFGTRKQLFTGVTANIAAGAIGTFDLSTFARAGQILRARFWPSVDVASFDLPFKVRFYSKETRYARDMIKEFPGYARRLRNSAAEPLGETSIAVAAPGSFMPGDAIFIDDIAGGISEHNRLSDVTVAPALTLETGLIAAINAACNITTVEEETSLGWWNDTVTPADQFKLFGWIKNEHVSQATPFRYEIELVNVGR